MSPKKIIEYIHSMRSREDLGAIINAAEARDNHLSNVESEERRKRAFARFSHLRKGDFVFIHKKVEVPARYKNLYGQTLKVHHIKPRVKEIIVGVTGLESRRTPGLTRVVLSALVASDLGLSEMPTASAVTRAAGVEEDE